MNYEREISNQLRRLGVNNSYVGFRYTIYGVAGLSMTPLCSLIYPRGYMWI